jgi:DNA replication and repair protein RecF
MLVKHLTLSHFRNHTATDLALQPGVNLLVGFNGQGKTNFVEAIAYLASLSSHRVAGYQPLIQHDQPQAIIRALVSHDERDILVEVELNRDTTNRARINKAASGRVRDVLGIVHTVVFAPEDLDIVKKDPSNRRAFIDQLVVQVWPRFAGVYSDYDRVLKQRNTLLRTARQTGTRGNALSTLDAWDDQMVRLGAEIVTARLDLIERLRPFLTKAYQDIAISNNEPTIMVRSSLVGAQVLDEDEELPYLSFTERAGVETMYREKLASVRNKELERGITLIGPHRDDLVLLLGGKAAKLYASHGESWSYALALRLASMQLLRQETRTGDPILILDDVFAELDAGRRTRLAELVADNEQVLITAAVAEDVPESLKAKQFRVENGVIENGE